ncbi:MAG: cyclic nucleotide-binding domain-containing protein, partial [Betaproteobacteria bacterium]
APWLRNLRGDILGGITAAVVTIPVSMGYGLLALAPLGESFISTAILAGLYAPVLGCLVAVVLGANTTMIYSPRSVVTFLVGSFVLHSLVRSSVPALQTASPEMLLALAFLLIFLVGCFQALFGLLRLGTLMKYIPAPVIAGFQNAAAILIFCSQLDSMFGFKTPVPLTGIPASLELAQLLGARITKAIPPALLGLITGSALYSLFVLLGWGGHLGQLVGEIRVALPTPHFLAEFKDIFMSPQIAQVLPLLLTGAASLAIIASLDGLLCARLVEADTGKRVHSNGELVRLGVGNMAAASFGGIAVGINLASSFANHRAGARTPLSLLVHAAAVALAVVALLPLIGHLPRVLIGAMLVAVAIQLFDRWTLQILRKLVTGDFPSARSMLDLSIILAVAVAAIEMNIVIAVAIGVAATVMLFLFRMSKSVIRREYRCDAVHSRKTREPKLMKILSDHGAAILVLELEGPLFFGTAENLALYLESVRRQNVSYVILDLKRVSEIDSTGAKVLLHAHDCFTKEGRHLLLSSFPERTQLAAFLKDMGVTAALTRGRLFPDADRAIEWCEDHLIVSQEGSAESGDEFPFSRIEVLANMSETELAAMKRALRRHTYRKGDIVFREGESGDELYVIAQGSASVCLKLSGSERETRLITFSPGTVFGEVALLDRETRSATVKADEDAVCYVLTRPNFDKLTDEHPAIAVKFLSNLGRELSGRLRRANHTIYQLAS